MLKHVFRVFPIKKKYKIHTLVPVLQTFISLILSFTKGMFDFIYHTLTHWHHFNGIISVKDGIPLWNSELWIYFLICQMQKVSDE